MKGFFFLLFFSACGGTDAQVRSAGSAVCSVGHVVVMGGIDNQNSIHNSVEALDPQTRRWSFLANMDEPRMDCAAVVVSDSILVSSDGTGSIRITPPRPEKLHSSLSLSEKGMQHSQTPTLDRAGEDGRCFSFRPSLRDTAQPAKTSAEEMSVNQELHTDLFGGGSGGVLLLSVISLLSLTGGEGTSASSSSSFLVVVLIPLLLSVGLF